MNNISSLEITSRQCHEFVILDDPLDYSAGVEPFGNHEELKVSRWYKGKKVKLTPNLLICDIYYIDYMIFVFE